MGARKKQLGNQKPRIDIFKDGDPRIAELTIELMAEYGHELLPWQSSTLMRWMALDENDKWANHENGLLVPRQNGKTDLAIDRIIGGMVFLGERLMFTAHSTDTVEEIKHRVLNFFYDAKPEIRSLLTDEFDKEPKSFDYIELTNGGRCVFRTRTRTGGLGFTTDTLIIDEAQELTDAQEEAIRPTLASGKSQNYQMIYMGTPPTAGSSGTVFLRTRKNVLDGKASIIAWREWSVESLTDKSDKKAWQETNPSLGYFLMEDAVKAEAATMSVDSFNKMRLGWIRGADSNRAIKDEEWNAIAVKDVKLPDNPSLVYAVKFAPDRSEVSLAVGVIMPNEIIHVELIEKKPMSYGLGWLERWLILRKDKPEKIIIDGAAGTQLLVEDLVRTDKKFSKKILVPNVKEAGAAFGGFYQAIKDKTVTHFNQPALNQAVRVAKTRDIGRDGAFGFASMNPDIQSDPLEAVALAHYGANRFRRKENEVTTQMVGLL